MRQTQSMIGLGLSTSVYQDDAFLTPYGPPSPFAYVLPIPNEMVGQIIGKGGEKIRSLQNESGAKI